MNNPLIYNLPSLSQEESLSILSQSIDELALASDYYKAVFYLEQFPDDSTENALLTFLNINSNEQSVLIAKRKAIEILGRFKSKKAIPVIARYLESTDQYIVENAVLAMKEIQCTDTNIHNLLIKLLDKTNLNKRVIIQTLASLKVKKALNKIRFLLDSSTTSPGVRGAAIAAQYSLNNDKSRINELKINLQHNNQNERQSAVQDVIDCNGIELLPSVVKSPISPFFKLLALDLLWPENQKQIAINYFLKMIDNSILGEPSSIDKIHDHNPESSPDSLVNDLFSTDFSRAYLALQTLESLNNNIIWPLIFDNLDRFRKDYGAIYFIAILFRLVRHWNAYQLLIINNFLISILESDWPEFMKFRPVVIISLIKLSPDKCCSYIPLWLDQSATPFWASRYATLMSLDLYFERNQLDSLSHYIYKSKRDENFFVREKVNSILTN